MTCNPSTALLSLENSRLGAEPGALPSSNTVLRVSVYSMYCRGSWLVCNQPSVFRLKFLADRISTCSPRMTPETLMLPSRLLMVTLPFSLITSPEM